MPEWNGNFVAFTQADLNMLSEEGATAYMDDVEIQVGDKCTTGSIGAAQVLKITLDKGYTFVAGAKDGTEDDVLIRYSGKYHDPIMGWTIGLIADFTYNEELTEATFQGKWYYATNGNLHNDTASPKIDVFQVYTNAPEVSEPILVVTEQLLTELSNSSVDMTIDGVPAQIGNEIVTDTVVVLTATGGYNFYTILYKEEDDPSAYISYSDPLGEEYRYFFTLSDDNKVATWTAQYGEGLTDTALVALTTDFVPNIAGTNKIYEVNNDQVSEVNDNRLIGGGSESTDYGRFLLGLKQFPFEIPTFYKGSNKNIKLSVRDTGVSAPQVLDDLIKIDLGSITVAEEFGDLRDFKGKFVMLHLPYTQPVTLDINYVMGQTIFIEYQVSMYSGDATINISSTKTGEVVKTAIAQMGIDIPYIQHQFSESPSNLNATVYGDNSVRTPFLEIMSDDFLYVDSLFMTPIKESGTLTDQTGTVRVDEIDLVSSALLGEKQELINLLAQGVIIKETP